MKKKNVNQFLDCSRQDAPKIEIASRKQQFIEIYQTSDQEQIASQAERCLECGNPYCQWKCPLHNFIPQWLKLAQEGRWQEAVLLSHQTNSLPDVCGRVCPQERLCEGSCTLDDGFGAVTIGNVEKYITDQAFAAGWQPDFYPGMTSQQRVAVIGAGPAGLACADMLARNGIRVTVFDRQEQIGGLLTFGIPAFKLEKQIMQRREQIYTAAGIEFKLNTAIGRDISFDQLIAEYDAVFVATGTYQAVEEPALAEHGGLLLESLDFLTHVNQQLLAGESLPIASQISGKRVVVLGGGDTAMDCIRTSLRLGAAEVTGVYRRSSQEMPGSRKEYQNACEEGSLFEFNAQPIGLIVNNGKLAGVRLLRTELQLQPDGSNKLAAIAGSEFVLAADVVITAFGFKPEALPWLSNHGIATDGQGRIRVAGPEQQSANPKVFAGGDIVRGASLVVHAIADGMRAAQAIRQFLGL